jgi:hypothetical protein
MRTLGNASVAPMSGPSTAVPKRSMMRVLDDASVAPMAQHCGQGENIFTLLLTENVVLSSSDGRMEKRKEKIIEKIK